MKSNLKKYFDSYRTRLVRTLLILLIGLVGLGITACGTLRGASSLDSVPADARESLLRVTVHLFGAEKNQEVSSADYSLIIHPLPKVPFLM